MVDRIISASRNHKKKDKSSQHQQLVDFKTRYFNLM